MVNYDCKKLHLPIIHITRLNSFCIFQTACSGEIEAWDFGIYRFTIKTDSASNISVRPWSFPFYRE